CPSCAGADNDTEGKLSFYIMILYCAIIDVAIAAPGRNGFTFFGPSSCSIDSGLVVTISIEPSFLTKIFFNLTTNTVGFC
ncbi:MAG TPA: hypothetical protein VFT15_02550, partial [Chitinophagaceae bacterium]|nr:hypothetical protein [Chitinophagaceae bacterium]